MVAIIALALGLVAASRTASALTLGTTARTFGVCAATTITNGGFTIVNGPIGLSPGTAITGFPPGVASSLQIGSASAVACQSEAATTYNTGQALVPTSNLSGQPLAGKTLTAGIYKYNAGATLNGVLTLNGAGNAASQFVFQIGTALGVVAGSKILLTNQAKACNVFFLVGSSATIGANSRINGTVIAYTAVGVDDAVVDVGGFYALGAAVTLVNDNITPPGTC